MNIRKVLYTILVVIWMITIFYFSNQQGTGSSRTSKKVASIIVNICDIKNEMTEFKKEEVMVQIEPIIRKIAHYTIYTFGGILLINCAFAYIKDKKRAILYSSIIGIVYATSDEIHQIFVAGRSGRIEDVLIDSIGVFTGIAIYLLLNKIVNKTTRIQRGRINWL